MTTEGVGQVVGVALVVALLLGFGALVALGALRLSRRMMQPRKPRAEQIAEFGRRFDGRPVVYHRTHWTFGPEEARAVAARHGYVEGPPHHGMLTFYPAGHRTSQGPAVG